LIERWELACLIRIAWEATDPEEITTLHGNLTFGFVILPVCCLAGLVAVMGNFAVAASLEVCGTAVAVGTGARWHDDGKTDWVDGVGWASYERQFLRAGYKSFVTTGRY
jgi:hypothetical protein